jgi:predicted PolB exonuclease-like 3'-5' exonuclease
MSAVIVWDLETIPDLEGFARANRMTDASDEDIRADMGDRFLKPPFHAIVCIGAVVAERTEGVWRVRASGAPNVGERPENELIRSFLTRIADLRPQLVTYNGSSFDLPVLRYRAMLHGIPAPGLFARPYFNRYTDDAIDVCDVLSSFGASTKMRLDEVCKFMGLMGKPGEIDGSQVEEFFRSGRLKEISDYCVSDVMNTYRLWLRYELFRGNLTEKQFEQSDNDAKAVA